MEIVPSPWKHCSLRKDSLSLEGPRMRLWFSLDAEPLLLPLGRHTEKGPKRDILVSPFSERRSEAKSKYCSACSEVNELTKLLLDSLYVPVLKWAWDIWNSDGFTESSFPK